MAWATGKAEVRFGGILIDEGQGAERQQRPGQCGQRASGEVRMKVFASIVLCAVATTPLIGQSHKDPNLVQRRSRPDVSTVSPPVVRSSGKQANSQLDRLERQTARIVAEPAARKTTAAPKLASTPDQHSTGFAPSMPVHAQSSGLKGAGSHGHSNSGRVGGANPRPH
jgi:hypothetical protein